VFKITKNEPDFFSKAKSKVALASVSDAWRDPEIEAIRPHLREHILHHEQNGLCVYCEKKIDSHRDNSNIDHFKLKAGHLFPEKTLDYTNLVVSCNTEGRCSTHKDSKIKFKNEYEKIVNPIHENPDEYFDYLLTGEIVPISDNEKANFTIDIFKLGRNENEGLSQTRKQLSETLKHLSNLSLEDIYESFGNEYQSFIRIIYPKLQQQGATQ
jgi:uncharacterized protein (TIGR02646 family)